MLDLILRILAWAVASWPHRATRGKHGRGAYPPAGRPTLGVVPAQPTTRDAWLLCAPSWGACRGARYGTAEPPLLLSSDLPYEVDPGPLVRAYVLDHEERQRASSLHLCMGHPIGPKEVAP